MKARVIYSLKILWIYLRTGVFAGPGTVYTLWQRSRRRMQRFRALYGRMYTSEELTSIIDKEIWYRQTMRRDLSEEELDHIIKNAMTWLYLPGVGHDMVSEDRHRD